MKGVFTVFFFVCLFQHGYCQKNILVPITKFSTIKEKSIANIRAIFKDKYGFVWIGTQDGLMRYDGTNNILYNKNNPDPSYSILNNDIDAIISTPGSDYLWVLSSYGGLSKINLITGKVIHKIKLFINGDSASNFLYTGIEYYKGSLFVATEKDYIFKINAATDQWESKKIQLAGPGEKIQRLYSINDQLLVCLNNSKIQLFDSALEKTISQAFIPHNNASIEFFVAAHLNTDEILLGTSEGVKKVIYNASKKELLVSDFGNSLYKSEKVNSLLNYNNHIWVAYNNSITEYPPNTADSYQYLGSKGFEENKWLSATTFLAAIDGQVWVGSEYGIAIIKKDLPFVPYFQNMANTIKLNHCFSLYPENDSIIYACTAEAFYKVNLNNTGISKIGNTAYYLTCFRGPGKEIIVSGFGGTFFKEQDKLVPISHKYPLLSGLDKEAIIASESFKDSLYFFGSVLDKGLYIFNYKKNELSNLNLNSIPLRLKSNEIKKLFIDQKDNLWIICDNLVSLYNIKGHSIRNYSILLPQTKEPLNIIKDVCRLKNDYFLAVYGMGVIQLNDSFGVKKVYAIPDGIQNVNLYKIFSVGDSLLITSGNEGVYSININTQKVKSYFEDYGLHSNFFEELSGTVHNNKIILGGINGFTVIDPGKLHSNTTKPLVYITSISIALPTGKSDISNLLIAALDIPNTALQTNIYFSGINYSNPQRTTFAYRIKEQGKDWINLNTQNFVTLIGLSPGVYHLQVKAANEDGVWSEPKELVLEFLPKWYQTWWFKLLVILAIASIIYAFYRYRIRQIKKQHEIRKNIATDLHDDLGSTLNSVKVFTNLAISGVKQEESLQQIKDNLNEATVGLRDMIWVLDDSLDTVDELVTRLKQYAIPVAAASNIETIIKADSEVNSRQLTKEEKRNLFLVCKEAINNSIKYSGASQIDVAITASGKKIKIIVADNGKGFNAEEAKKGYGLKNMQYRAGQIKYKIALNTAPGKGTQINIKPV